MKAKVDHNLCSGDGICEELCPAVFKMNDNDQADVIADPVPPEEEDACREAAESCPEECISLED